MAPGQLRSVLTSSPGPVASISPQEAQAAGFDAETCLVLANAPADLPRANILSDLPAREDALGFTPLVRTLSNIVLSRATETPVTIAVDGEWGSGKTTILRLVEAQARMVNFSCIWLNAWSLESAENLIAVVAREMQAELRRQSSTPAPTTLRRLGGFVANALVNTLDSFSAIKAAPLLKALSIERSKLEIEDDVLEVATVVSSQQAFRDLVDVLLGASADRRLLVFIDDIDRALPDQVATILKNLKLLLESPRCIFLLGMDMRMVARLVEDHYLRHAATGVPTEGRQAPALAEHEGFGCRYLEKLVQLRVAVPRLGRHSLKPYLETLSIADEVSAIVAWAPDRETQNPRRLKRLINWMSLSLQLLSSLRSPEPVDHALALRLLMLRRYYPALYKTLLDRGSLPWAVVWQMGGAAAIHTAHEGDEFESFARDLDGELVRRLDRLLAEHSLFDAGVGAG